VRIADDVLIILIKTCETLPYGLGSVKGRYGEDPEITT
jgi:hypothetical protein